MLLSADEVSRLLARLNEPLRRRSFKQIEIKIVAVEDKFDVNVTLTNRVVAEEPQECKSTSVPSAGQAT
jgi:hypothetical protein